MTKHISHTCGRRSCRPARYLSSSNHSHISERCLATALRVSSSITTGHYRTKQTLIQSVWVPKTMPWRKHNKLTRNDTAGIVLQQHFALYFLASAASSSACDMCLRFRDCPVVLDTELSVRARWYQKTRVLLLRAQPSSAALCSSERHKFQNYMQWEQSKITVLDQSEDQKITIFGAPLLRNCVYPRRTQKHTRLKIHFFSSGNSLWTFQAA